MKIKNVVIIEDSSKHNFGGGQRVTLNVIEALKRTFNVLTVDCEKNSFFQEEVKKSYVSCEWSLKCFGKVKNGSRQSFSLGFLEILIWPLFLLINLFKLKTILNRYRYTNQDTLIYTPHKKTLLLAFLFKKFFKFQYIFHAHTIDNRDSIFYKIIDIPQKNALTILCVSNAVRNNIDLNHCVTLYNSLDQNTKKGMPRIISEKKIITVAVFSTLIPMKGIEYFINSYNYENQLIKYKIYGLGPLYEKFKNAENKHIKIMGFTKNTLLEMQSVDLVVIPSIEKESFGMVAIEAFSQGIPVITTNIGGQSEIVIDGKVGLHVSIKNSIEINKAIQDFANDPSKYSEFSSNALQYAEEFYFDTFYKKLNNIIKELDEKSISA